MKNEEIIGKETRRGFFAAIFSVPEEHLRKFVEKTNSELDSKIIFLRKSGGQKLYVRAENELSTEQQVQQLIKRDSYKKEARNLLGEDTPEKVEPQL